ncbi:hypothetical protein B0H10DRAFT_1944920 [Mycena sp. CBHHK59/15]|nr:hypothetical protein B0H10DRAFT_1944920 [Mycena sp. CBHHK59/15]
MSPSTSPIETAQTHLATMIYLSPPQLPYYTLQAEDGPVVTITQTTGGSEEGQVITGVEVEQLTLWDMVAGVSYIWVPSLTALNKNFDDEVAENGCTSPFEGNCDLCFNPFLDRPLIQIDSPSSGTRELHVMPLYVGLQLVLMELDVQHIRQYLSAYAPPSDGMM